MTISHEQTLHGNISETPSLKGGIVSPVRQVGGGLSSKTYEKDYEKLVNHPSIENVELIGNKELEEIGVDKISTDDLIRILV